MINDTLGHSMGNNLLKAVAGRLKDSLRKNDTAARWGGDEFVIVLPEIGADEEVTAAAARLLFAFQNPVNADGHTLQVSLSLGISIFPDNGADFEELFKQADSAMYQAKRTAETAMRLLLLPIRFCYCALRNTKISQLSQLNRKVIYCYQNAGIASV